MRASSPAGVLQRLLMRFAHSLCCVTGPHRAILRLRFDRYTYRWLSPLDWLICAVSVSGCFLAIICWRVPCWVVQSCCSWSVVMEKFCALHFQLRFKLCAVHVQFKKSVNIALRCVRSYDVRSGEYMEEAGLVYGDLDKGVRGWWYLHYQLEPLPLLFDAFGS